MRLAFLTHEPFFPPSGGGSAEAVYLVRECVRRGHEVHVFCPAVADPDRVQAEFRIKLHPFTLWAMGRYTSFRSLKYALYPLFLARQVARAARKTRFEAVWSQHAISAVAAGRLKRRLRVPVVMNQLDFLTGFMETWPVWLMPPPLLAVLKKYELSLPRRFDVDAVLTVSDPLAEAIAATGFARDKIRSIYYGYDAALFALDARALALRHDAPPTIVMHGSFDHHHLGAIALDALARVQREFPEVVFRFIGHSTEALRRFVGLARKLGLERNIQCAGFVPYPEVARQLASASVGIVPYEESAGVHCAFVAKVVEYLALGLPVVCTPLHGIRRYFSDEPLLRFSRFTGDDFGQQILAWLHTPLPERAALAEPANRRVRRELDWNVICARAVQFVEATCAQRPST